MDHNAQTTIANQQARIKKLETAVVLLSTALFVVGINAGSMLYIILKACDACDDTALTTCVTQLIK